MFLDVLRRRNPALIEASIKLHQEGKIPPNTYVIDLDTVESNTRLFRAEADKYDLKSFAMTKQVGRNSGFCKAVMRGGIHRNVAVDLDCAIACNKAGLKTGHLGHLVQIPRHQAVFAARHIQPDFWTIFSREKAQEASRASKIAGRVQDLLARIQTNGDIFYRGHEGGFRADDIVCVAEQLDVLEGGRFAGVTSFPALLFDAETGTIKPTPNLATLEKAANALVKAGYTNIEINAPGTTSLVMLQALASAGATQCEPGNGLHGSTPLHAL
ncbi:MAG: amino-acid racemase, partial [Hyphomicrobiales bacterium]